MHHEDVISEIHVNKKTDLYQKENIRGKQWVGRRKKGYKMIINKNREITINKNDIEGIQTGAGGGGKKEEDVRIYIINM
jgi:hypothetical protein